MLTRLVALVVCAFALFLTPGCGTPSLEPGGAYSPPGQVADLPFEVVDAAFNFSRTAVDAAFHFEQGNRALLWSLNPGIKHTLDSIRPQATAAWLDYAKARAAYKANPVPANLTTLQRILATVQQLTATAVAVIPTATPTK